MKRKTPAGGARACAAEGVTELRLFFWDKLLLSYQRCLGLFPGSVVPLVRGFGGVSCEGLLYAAFVLGATPDIAVVGVFGDDLILPVHCCKTRNGALVP